MMSDIKDIYGLTPSQEGIYAQYFRNNNTSAYHLRMQVRIKKATDIALIKQSAELLAQRHEVLKTAFAVSKSTGVIKQVILKSRVPKVTTIEKTTAFSQEILDAIAKEDAEIDLQKDSLFQITVVDFTDARFLLFHIHHIIIDGWCLPILIKDLQSYYAELSNGTDVNILSERISKDASQCTSYAQYVNWIRGQNTEEASGYWRKLLAGNQSDHLFGNDRKADDGDKCIIEHKIPVSAELSDQIERFARKLRVSFNTVFECAFGLSLQKYSGTDDIVFDKVISGRSIPLKNIDRTVGLFINTVPVRLNAAKNRTIFALLQQIQKQNVDANRYGLLPLAELYKVCGITRNDIDALFVFENYYTGDLSDIEGGSLGIELSSSHDETEFNLTVTVSKLKGSYLLNASYVSEVYSEKEISDLMKGYLYILEQIVSLTEQKLSDENSAFNLRKLSPKEQQTILSDFNNTCVPYNKKQSIYEIFAEKVKREPDKTAVSFKDQTLSYRELLNQIDEYADKLHDLGIRKGNVVAVHLEKSPLIIVFQFAVLKLGAVFLPADKRYPSERLRFLCEDCNVDLFITDSDNTGITNTLVMPIEQLKKHKAKKSGIPMSYAESAYIIYTSGSTGTPKGCMLFQSGLVNFCMNNNTLAFLKRKEYNTFVSVNSVSFDYFIAESLLPLLNGFSTILCDEDESIRQDLFFKVIEKHHVNVLMTTPTRLALYYDDKRSCEELKMLDCICSSGEPLPTKLLERIYQISSDAKVYNPLGPSECTVWDLGGELQREAGCNVHIGKPIANTQAYIVDKYINLVPIGVTGELCIAGDGVGAGYINRPELTAEKFIENPFGEGKLYKTGDLAYWREDGNIVYVGRNDFQVKIRGLRIELGEIENAIVSVEGVEQAVVVAKHDPDMLIAFYQGKQEQEHTLRIQLRNTLPSYMVPSRFIYLESFPLTTNGKIDRRKLSDIELPPIEAESTEDNIPKNPTEKYVCDLFSRILAVDNVSRNSNFFDLGGTSLTMISVLSEEVFKDVTAARFIASPTPAQLAEMIDALDTETDQRYLEPMYTSKNAKDAFVLFSYAGGDASAYAALANEFSKKKSAIALYYVDWPTGNECYSEIAEEIKHLATHCNVSFYSHCAGSVVAMKLLDILNADQPIVKRYIAGASIPPGSRISAINLWAYMNDADVIRYLEVGGFKREWIQQTTLQKIIKKFRVHTDEYSSYFAAKKEKTNCNTVAIISTSDPFTKNYSQADRLWKKRVTDFEKTILIDCPSHYFQSDNAKQLSDIISSYLEKV